MHTRNHPTLNRTILWLNCKSKLKRVQVTNKIHPISCSIIVSLSLDCQYQSRHYSTLQRHHHTGKTVVIYLAEVKYFGPKGKPQYFNKKFGRKCCSKHIFWLIMSHKTWEGEKVSILFWPKDGTPTTLMQIFQHDVMHTSLAWFHFRFLRLLWHFTAY